MLTILGGRRCGVPNHHLVALDPRHFCQLATLRAVLEVAARLDHVADAVAAGVTPLDFGHLPVLKGGHPTHILHLASVLSPLLDRRIHGLTIGAGTD